MSNIIAQQLFRDGLDSFKKKKFPMSQEYFEKLLVILPSNIGVLENLALAYYFDNKFYQSELRLKQIIKLGKKDKGIIETLLATLIRQDKIKELTRYTKEGKSIIDPKYQISEKFITPTIPENSEEIDYFRNQALNNLQPDKDEENIILDIDNQLIDPPGFRFSYDKYNNLKINTKIVKFLKKTYPILNKNFHFGISKNNKIKIGFISQFFSKHTIGKLFKGIIFNLDQTKFEIKVFHLHSTKKDSIFFEFLEKEKKFQLKNIILPKKFEDKIKIVENEGLDIIFYPDIGMSSELYYLTFLRLAKYQLTSWGHPETTGNPNIDYFLSSSLLEVESSEKKYSEKLLLSKYLPMYFYRPSQKPINDSDISKQNIYSCPQTLIKLHPNFDEVIKKILEKDKKAKIFFIKDKNKAYYKKIINRFDKKMSIYMDRIKFLDPMSEEEYINHCGTSSVLLDPLFFGAGNSFHESMFYGTPTVSLPTNYLKSRIVLGAYKQMKVDKAPIVSSIEDYADLAVELANNDTKKILDQKKYYQDCALNELYENEKALLDVEDNLIKLTK